MPLFKKNDVSIYYEVRGSGYPLLLLPPGGMAATIDVWQRVAFNAAEVFAEDFRVIAIDQRNAGRSSGPIDERAAWGAYLEDHIGLLNHLGIERCHVLGCCIGVSYALNLLRGAPDRVAAAVLMQPVGIDGTNRPVLLDNFRGWADAIMKQRPDLDPAMMEAFGDRIWGGDFVLSVTREDVKACAHPMLVLPGNDVAHPTAIGREVAALAPNAEILEPWKEPADLLPGAVARIRSFLHAHSSAGRGQRG